MEKLNLNYKKRQNAHPNHKQKHPSQNKTTTHQLFNTPQEY